MDKIKQLSTVFAVDICAFAVLSNHYHIVLSVNQEEAKGWSDEEVIEKWYSLFNGHPFVDQRQAGETLSRAVQTEIKKLITTWHNRLMDISWFMRCLNEAIAREANKEDNCKGRFWPLLKIRFPAAHGHPVHREGRFKSQALLDETALLTCMMYVDLNPIRAGLSTTLEGSDFTSVQERLLAYTKLQRSRKNKSASKTNSIREKLTSKKGISTGEERNPCRFTSFHR